jgi:hypothetical protein
MIQLRGELRLAPEPPRGHVIPVAPLVTEHLHHSHPPQLQMLCAIHIPETTASDLLSENVVT